MDTTFPTRDASAGPLSVKVTNTEPKIDSKPIDLRLRRDLMKIVEKAQQMADNGEGRRPQYLGAVSCDTGARRQYSFSRLTGTLHARPAGNDSNSLDADASAATPLDARGLGTLVHAVLAEIDFTRPGDVRDLVRRHAEEQLLDSANSLDDATELIGRFLTSPRAAAMALAGETHRELEFLLAWPLDGHEAATGGRDSRYLQGFIDCLYCDASGQWRLVDYKTNRVTTDTLAATAEQYELQMLVYALAVEQILGCPPAELALCFLRPGLEHRFDWNAAARQRAVELVDVAMPQ